MATLTYSDGAPIHLAPSLALSPTGNIVTHTASDFAIRDLISGFTVTFHSASNSFTYNVMNQPDAGTIDSMQITDSTGSPYATMVGPFGDSSLPDLYFTLINVGSDAALDQLAGPGTVVRGSTGSDQMETYGDGTHIIGGGGNDTFDISDDDTTATGGRGNDRFVIDTTLSNTRLNGGGGINSVVSDIPDLSFALPGDRLANITNFTFGPGAVFIHVPLNELHAIGPHHVHITGNGGPDSFVIEPPTVGRIPTTIDASHIQLTNFNHKSDFLVWQVGGGVGIEIHISGADDAHNYFIGGKANDDFVGGNKGDLFFGGPGHNIFEGHHGVNTGLFDGPRSDFRIVHLMPGLDDYRITDLRPGRLDGINTLVNIQEAQFTDMTLDLGRFGVHRWAAHHAQINPADFDLHS
jgi:hypothetical protein